MANSKKLFLANWLSAFRLRTLPLALSCILVGNFSAYYVESFSIKVFVLAVITTVFLQILSNLANDYGDAKKGLDNDDRIGPKRTVSSGLISASKMKIAMAIFAFLAFSFGIWLLMESVGIENSTSFLTFFILGLLSIWAAIKYTIGKNPYGYRALGDLFVFIFFGVVGVCGSYYLQANTLNFEVLLNAVGIGFLSTAVLNMNNLRDRTADAKNGKITLAVKLGERKTKIYHIALVLSAFLVFMVFVGLNYQKPIQLLPFIFFIFLIKNLKNVWQNKNPQLLDAELKRVALSTFGFALLFALTTAL